MWGFLTLRPVHKLVSFIKGTSGLVLLVGVWSFLFCLSAGAEQQQLIYAHPKTGEVFELSDSGAWNPVDPQSLIEGFAGSIAMEQKSSWGAVRLNKNFTVERW